MNNMSENEYDEKRVLKLLNHAFSALFGFFLWCLIFKDK